MATATKGFTVTIRNLDGLWENVAPEPGVCAACGMATKHPREYHPYAACLMFMGCHNGDRVRGNLEGVILHARDTNPAGTTDPIEEWEDDEDALEVDLGPEVPRA